MARYKASSRKAYSLKRKPRLIPLTRFSYHVDAIPSKVQKILKRYKAEFKHQTECPICGENSLMVFEDSSGTIETCVNPKCTLYGDINYYPNAGGP